jgi:tetratricopeptide (TPR) repeat protein
VDIAAPERRRCRLLPARSWCAGVRLLSGALLVMNLGALPAAAGPATTLEAGNPAIAAAKLRQQLAPTLDNERRLAQMYAEAGILDAAFDHFSAALRLDEHDAPSLEGLARIWRDWGFVEVALPYAHRAVYWNPDSAGAQNTEGTILLELGQIDAAFRRFAAARALDPSASYPLNNLCYLERLRGDLAAAYDWCRAAAARDAESPVVRNNLALTLAADGRLETAIATIAAGDAPAVNAYNEGMLRLAAGQTDKARAAFTRARIADPTFGPALARLRQIAAAAAHD